VCNIDGSDFTILTEDTFPDFSPKISQSILDFD
ncbi:unnamed protein product, partial [marine sediment metagenome]